MRYARRLVLVSSAGAVLAALPSIVGARYWMLDNLASAAPHLSAVLAALAALGIALGNRRSALITACTAALLGARVYPHRDVAAPEAGSARATWLVANVYTANTDHAQLITLIRARKPDVVGLVETDSRWLRALEGPLAAYPHRILHPREDNFGIALYSRLPLADGRVRDDFGTGPTITATITLGQREVDLVLVHVLPPVSAEYTAERDQQLARLGALRPRSGHALVLAGDFNATPYSASFQASFAQPTFVRPGGFAGTWPAQASPWLRVPLDHVLAAGAVSVRRTVERDINSDHLPFVAELRAD